MAATVPNCRAWDPAFAGEVAVIMDHAMRRMLVEQRDEFHYVTLMNENYEQPSLALENHADLLHGMYRLSRHEAPQARAEVRLLGSGTILREVIAAAGLLAADWQIASDVFSVTSFSELARDAREVERGNRLQPGSVDRVSHVQRLLAGDTPVVAATDYVRAWPQLIAEYIDARFVTLGTDGFGRSDTRSALRHFFEVDRHHIVLAALQALVREGRIERAALAGAVQRYGLAADALAPWNC
jgi:pyruvate dehydrogenase E1 component